MKLFRVGLIGLYVLPGFVSAQLTIQDNGVPAFSYPIAVPPGIAGMEPKLSLGYRQGGDGPVGVGWSIGGVSIIARCPSTPATDGSTPLDSSARRGVQYNSADKLCIDGQRLIQTDANGVPLSTQVDDARGTGGGIREFRTEQDTFTRVRAYGNANGSDANGPAYFRAWTKSGQIYEYGNTADSNVDVEGAAVTNFWGVNRISDTTGNWIDFTYEKRDVAWGTGTSSGVPAGKEWNLSEVRYTGHAGVTPYSRVAFVYADRASTSDNAQSRSEGYNRGAKTVSVRYLQSVRTFTNRTATEIPVRVYKLNYDVSPVTRRLRLTGIQDCRGSNESICLPAVSMSYTAGGNEAYQPAPNSGALAGTRFLRQQDSAYGVLLGDFDGDGKTDIIRWSNTPSENQLFLSRPTASGSIASPDNMNFVQVQGFNITDENLVRNDGCYFSIVADFNGDGKADILRWAARNSGQKGDNASCGSSSNSYIYFSRGDGTFEKRLISNADGSALILPRLKAIVGNSPRIPIKPMQEVDEDGFTSAPISAGATFYVGDFDGDGRLDIVVANQEARSANDSRALADCYSGQCTFVYKGLGDGRFTLVSSPTVANASLYTDPTAVGPTQRSFIDVDGDGLEDLYQPFTGNHFRSLGNGDFVPKISDVPIICYSDVQFGDFNGDHRIDRLCGNSQVSNNRISISRGDGSNFFASQFNLINAGQELVTQISANGTPTSGGVGYTAIDINGDGMTDIIRWKDDASQNKVYLSNGDGSFRESATANATLRYLQLNHSNGQFGYVVGDFTGRGNVDIFRVHDDPSQNTFWVKQDQTPPDLLVSVTSGLGSSSSVAYASIAQVGAPYTLSRLAPQDPFASSTYPKFLLQTPSYVVSKLWSDAGLAQAPVESHFAYRDMGVDWTGRGMLGFAETRRSSPGPNGEYLTTTTSYQQDFPYIGIANSIVQRRGDVFDSGSTISSSTSTYCDRLASNGCTGNSGKVRQPYVQQVVEQGYDLNNIALPTTTTTNTYDTYGNPTQIVVQTTGVVGGVSQTFTKVSTNTYSANTSGDTWLLGRLTRAAVSNTVPDDVLATSAGLAANAANTQGVPPPAYQPPSAIDPAVLTIILNYLLQD